MTKLEAQAAIKKIRKVAAADSEAAHVAEDELLWKFVTDVSKSEGSAFAEAARIVLSSKRIKFDRWSA